MSSSRYRTSQSGVALVAVLWGVLLLSILAAAVGTEARTEARLARTLVAHAEARAAADAGVFWAVGSLADGAERPHLVADGTRYDITFAGARLLVSVQDEAGKVDLNAARMEHIAAALIAAGADSLNAQQIAESIDERRRAVREPSAAGERGQHRNDSYRAVVGGPFRLVDELRGLPGVRPSLYEAVAPLLTVHSGKSDVDPSTAPLALLEALQDPDAGAPGAGIGRGDARRARANAQRPTAANARQTKLPTGVYTIDVAATTAAGAHFARRAVVLLTAQPQSPYRFLQWTEW